MKTTHKITLHLSAEAWSSLEAIAAADDRYTARELAMMLEVMAGVLPAGNIGPEELGRRLEGAFLRGGKGLPEGRALPVAEYLIDFISARAKLQLAGQPA